MLFRIPFLLFLLPYSYLFISCPIQHKSLMIRNYCLFLLLFLAGYISMAQEFSQWHGPNRDGKYIETGLLKSWPLGGPTMLWSYTGLGEGHASAAVTVDRIYTAGMVGNIGFIYSFSLNGKLVWKVAYGLEWFESWPGTRSTPLIFDGKLYFMSGFGKLICLDSRDGTELWKVDIMKEFDGRNIQWGITENLLIDSDKLFCTAGGTEHNVLALNRNTGKLIWSSGGNGERSAYCSPQLIHLKNRTLLVTMTEASILGIDAANGKLLWRHPQTNKYSVHANTPYFQNGNLYCVSGYGTGGVMLKISEDGTAKQEIWRNTSLDNRMGGFIVLGDRIYGSDDENKAWFVVDWKTGTDIYSEKILSRGNVIYADGMLYCYGDSGEVALVEPTTSGFRKISSFQVPLGTFQHWAHLVIRDGRLYVRHGNSLMVYDIRSK